MMIEAEWWSGVYHDVFAREVKVGQLFVERMKEGHSAWHVESEADCLCRVDHHSTGHPAAFVQDAVERPVDHKLVDDNQIGRVVAAADDGQHVGVREDAQAREFLVKVARDASRAVADGEDLGYDVVALPRTAPRLTRRRHGQFLHQRQLLDVDAFMARKGCVAYLIKNE